MDAQAVIVPLLTQFASCFTKPGYEHFRVIMMSRMGLLGLPHCVTELLRLSRLHEQKHWTTPYHFLSKGRFSCTQLSQCLLDLLVQSLALGDELILAIDDTLVKKIGKAFFGLGYYVDPTDKNPGAHKRRVRGHCWVVLALLFRQGSKCFAFPLAALLFVPEAVCAKQWTFKTKIELAEHLLKRFAWSGKRLILLVDNLYAKGKLAFDLSLDRPVTMISRLRSNAALYQLPKPVKQKKRGRPRLRGEKVAASKLYRRRSKRHLLTVDIYGKTVTIDAFVDILMPSCTLGAQPILVVIFPQRSGKKMNIFFSTDLSMDPLRLLELYALRFKIEDAFDELKTFGGFADCRQRSFIALKRHATFSLIAYSLLRLLSLTLSHAQTIETEPWWQPQGPPSVTRLRRAVAKGLAFSFGLHKTRKPSFIYPLKRAA
jgi:hypothetical protein